MSKLGFTLEVIYTHFKNGETKVKNISIKQLSKACYEQRTMLWIPGYPKKMLTPSNLFLHLRYLQHVLDFGI